MNKEDILKNRKLVEQQEEQKVMNAIHANYRKNNVSHRIAIQKSKLDKLKLTEKTKRKNKLKNITITILLIIIILCLGYLLSKEGDAFMKECISAGNSQFTCAKGR